VGFFYDLNYFHLCKREVSGTANQCSRADVCKPNADEDFAQAARRVAVETYDTINRFRA